jgi:hypothetical protein
MSLDSNAGEPATTYYEASSRFGPGTHEARERFDELTTRDLLARAYATLKARGEYDPQKHGDGSTEPLTAGEHLEVLAAGELLARYYRHPARIDKALDAGVTWQQVADATDVSPDQARQDYRSWAEGQHRLWADYEGKFGMSDAEYAAALRRSEIPAVAPGATRDSQMEAGQ